MSVTREVTVWCDNCARWEQASLTAKQLRKKLRSMGWKQKGTKDYCPECKER